MIFFLVGIFLHTASCCQVNRFMIMAVWMVVVVVDR